MDSERLARLKRKLEALNYDGISDPKLDELAEKVVPGLMTFRELLVDIHTISTVLARPCFSCLPQTYHAHSKAHTESIPL